MILTTKYKLIIGWLYPELMSTYGDRGNIIVLQKRCEWRGIDVEVRRLDLDFSDKQLAICDVLFMGGAQDRQQTIVAQDLRKKAGTLKQMIEDGIPGLYICGAYQFLGRYYKFVEQRSTKEFASSAYKEADGTMIDGLGILDLYTENPGLDVERLIGNVVIKSQILNTKYLIQNTNLVGFENHGGRTHLGKGIKPLGKIVKGFGNNGEDGTEGAVYKNSFGSYFHGPILPKNPHFADLLIKLALEKKYGESDKLKDLDDSLELQAHEAMLQRFKI